LEAHQNKFPNFICNNPTSRKVSGQDEDIEERSNGTAQEEEM
jgi:hypothetical protein